MSVTAPRTRLTVGRVGDRVLRDDAVPKVNGAFEYASDLSAPGMLWGDTLRSPHAHARVVSIDLSAALRVPGVHAVLTHADVPGTKLYGLEFADQPVLAIDRVRYVGEPVAIVAAEHPEQAREALEAIVVEYEPLEPVVDMERALEQEPLHPDRPTMGHGYRDDPRPNVVRHIVIRHGDPDTPGDVVVSGTYELGIQDQAFLGPESGLAVPDGEGGVDVYVATQWLHVDRDQVAPCLGLRPEQVRIHLAGVGGAFGGREDLSMQIHGALLALHTSRPVKMVYDRAESFTGHVHRHPARIRCEHRATREGRLTCVRMQILLDGGAYASSSTAVASNAASFALGPYRVDNALIESTAVYTNNPPCGAMRGFGAVQTCFAAEAQMDLLAAELGIDPVELRLLNALEPGDTLPTGQVVTGSLPTREVIRRAAALPLPGAGAPSPRPVASSRRRREHDARRGRPSRRRLRARVQEHLLLGGLRRLLHRPGRAARRRERNGPFGRRRGGPGSGRGDAAGRPHGARHRRRDARPAHDGGGRLGRIHVGVTHDLDGGRRGSRCVPRGARGTGAPGRRRGGRRAGLPASEDDAARSRDRPDHRRAGARRPRGRGDARGRRGRRRARADARRLDRHRAGRRQGGQPARRRGPDRGRHRAGARSRADGGAPHARRGDPQRELHGLPDPDGARHAAGGHRARRGAGAGRALRGEGRRGAADGRLDGGDRLRAARRDRSATHPRARAPRRHLPGRRGFASRLGLERPYRGLDDVACQNGGRPRSTSSSVVVVAKGSASARSNAASAPGNEPRSR